MQQNLVIMFAYHFPPENVIGALRPFRFYKYLLRDGYRVHVITASDVSQVPEIDAQQISDPFVKSPDGLGWQVERAVRRVLLPGAVGSQWALRAYRAALAYMNSHPEYRVTLFSTFPPVGTHLAAYWLARRKGLPWIADFRDPLADNSVYNHISSFHKKTYRRLEKLVVLKADFSIANTDAAEEKLKRTYPSRANRIHLIWNGFDPEERLIPLPVPLSDRKVLAHVGELYGGRSVAPLLHSLRRLIDAGKLSPSNFQVQLTGPVVEGSVPDSHFMETASGEGWVKLNTARVPQREALQLVQSADTLLLVQPQSAVQVPGKLYEYLQIGRPILAFVPTNSAVERILAKSGVPYRCVYSSDGQDELDRSIMDFFSLQSTDGKPNEWFETEFNALRHAAKVSELIQRADRLPAPSPALAPAHQDLTNSRTPPRLG